MTFKVIKCYLAVKIMSLFKENCMKKQNFDLSWKNKNPMYLCEIQKFLDKVDNIENENLKQDIIHQMLRCDQVLTALSHEMFCYYYKKGLCKTLLSSPRSLKNTKSHEIAKFVSKTNNRNKV